MCICWCLFEIVILVQGYEKDKVNNNCDSQTKVPLIWPEKQSHYGKSIAHNTLRGTYSTILLPRFLISLSLSLSPFSHPSPPLPTKHL